MTFSSTPFPGTYWVIPGSLLAGAYPAGKDAAATEKRMTALLGERYNTAMQLLHTANQLQQEGPLFFVVSRFTPIPEIAEGAGLVWNSETNQMAALLRSGGVAEVFKETAHRAVITQANNALQEAVPVWPAVLQPWLAESQKQGVAAPTP